MGQQFAEDRTLKDVPEESVWAFSCWLDRCHCDIEGLRIYRAWEPIALEPLLVLWTAPQPFSDAILSTCS
jgi:hypothetical protein